MYIFWQALLANKLGQALREAGLKTEIWAYDHNTDVPEFPELVLKNASMFVDTVAWHCYDQSAEKNWSVLSTFHAAFPGAKQYMTECWTHLNPNGKEGFFELADFVTGPLQNYAAGAMAWTLGGSTAYDVAYPGPGSCSQCSGIVQVDMAARTFVKTQDFYVLGQFSRFVRKGAVYLSNSGSYTYADGTGVEATAFRNPDGSRVVVIVNKIRNDLHLELSCEHDTWNAIVLARSVTTWILPPAAFPLSPV